MLNWRLGRIIIKKTEIYGNKNTMKIVDKYGGEKKNLVTVAWKCVFFEGVGGGGWGAEILARVGSSLPTTGLW